MSVATPHSEPLLLSQSPPVTTEPAWEIAKLFPHQGQWSEGDYLSLDTSHLVELSHGNIEVLEMATELHQAIVGFLYEALLLFTRPAKLGTVRFSPLPIKLHEDKFREPDVLFMKAEHSERRHNQYWEGADLVMEVVSDDDRRRDLELKRFEYSRAAIPEYWIIDPMKNEITVLALSADHYEPLGTFKPGTRAFSMMLPGFGVDVTEVFDAK